MMKPEVVTAVVQAGVDETEYARAGSGRPVVLLLRASSNLDAITADPLFAGLSRELRVVAPAVPVDRELSAWVRGLVDGLGLERPAVVMDVAVAGAAVPVVIEEDRCGCVVVLHPVTSGSATARQARPGTLDRPLCRVPVFELELDTGGGLTGSSLALLLAFLRRPG